MRRRARRRAPRTCSVVSRSGLLLGHGANSAVASPEALSKHFARCLGSPDMPAGFIHPLGIEALEDPASQVADPCFIAIGIVATTKRPPAAQGHLIPGPSYSFCHQVKHRCIVHQRSIPSRGIRDSQINALDRAARLSLFHNLSTLVAQPLALLGAAFGRDLRALGDGVRDEARRAHRAR
jgi:hypothetical protein